VTHLPERWVAAIGDVDTFEDLALCTHSVAVLLSLADVAVRAKEEQIEAVLPDIDEDDLHFVRGAFCSDSGFFARFETDSRSVPHGVSE
jgi:hypothetical protein